MISLLKEAFSSKKELRSLTSQEIKCTAQVLIIDDEKPEELIALLKKEGWRLNHITDLDSLSNKKLAESHVICIDIMGVGKKLQETSGLPLVRRIKQQYPEKKIILYSSVSNHDIFEDALDFVDIRLRKQASLVPFTNAIEKMASETLSYNEAILSIYKKIEKSNPHITYEDFKKAVDKSTTKSGIDTEKVTRVLNLTDSSVSLVASALKLIVWAMA